jgi:hypothetical protein
MKQRLAAALACLPFSLLLFATPARAEVVETPEGTLEVLGLESWTVEKIRLALAERFPGVPPELSAMALGELGFPSVSIQSELRPEGRTYTVITLVEPERADRVRRKAPFPSSRVPLAAWQDMVDLVSKQPGSLQVVAAFFPAVGPGVAIPDAALETGPADPKTVRRLWKLVESRRSEADRDLALWALANDPNVWNRATAAVLLANFPDRDLTWWTLLDAQRDPAGIVSAIAGQVLQGLSRRAPRKVDWQPALGSVRALLDGANLFAFDTTLDVLVATGLSPDFSRELLRAGGADLVLARLGARHEPVRKSAHGFLKYLSGKDLGTDAAGIAAWRTWLDGLGGPVPEAAPGGGHTASFKAGSEAAWVRYSPR